jgi:gliding motility-associated-like protein
VTPPGNYSFLWIRDGNNLGGQVGQFMIATVSGEYTVRVRNQQSGCDLVTNPLTVEIFEPITVSINSGPLCDNGEPFTLKADAITTADTVIYEWSRNGSVIAGQVADSLQSTTNGIYEVTATTEDGCSVSSSYTVTLSPVNVITLPEASTICPLDSDPLLNSVELDAGTGFTQYMWFDNNGNIVSNNQVYTASIEGKYTVIGTNQFGCTTEASSVVIEDCVPRVFGPNAFRPKGTNDEFFLFTKYIIDFEIFIYNRWGGLVYHSNQEDFRWDGIFEGRLLPAGTYAYKVRFKSEFNPLRGMMEKHGGVTLLR